MNLLVKSHEKSMLFATGALMFIFFAGCASKQHLKMISAYNMRGDIWSRNIVSLMERKYNDEDYDITFEVLLKQFFTGVAYSASYEYTDSLLSPKNNEWELLKNFYELGYIENSWLDDPYSLKEFYVMHPNESPMLLAVDPDIIENKEEYEKFVKWFKDKIISHE